MSGRLTLSLLAVIAVWGSGHARAQGPASGDVVTAQGWQSQQSTVDPAGFGYHPYGHSNGGYIGPASPVYEELVPGPAQNTYYGDPMLDLTILDVVEDVWCDLEYLNYHIERPGDTLLGAPLANIPDPREPFFVTLPNNFVGIARVSDVDNVRFDNLNGLRARLGIPFKYFSIEGAIWGLEQDSNYSEARDIPPNAPQNFQSDLDFVGTSLLTDGAIGGRVILYDGAFNFTYKTSMWAAESNVYLNLLNPRQGLRFHPLLGARYEHYEERLRQSGTLDNSSGAFGLDVLGNPIIIDPVTNEIRSDVWNDRYEVQTGFRTEWADEYFTIGVEPKIGLGGNWIDARVSTMDLRDTPTDPDIPPVLPAVDDGATLDQRSYERFAATLDVGVYAKWHVNSWLDLKVGYNFYWMSDIARADRSIYYNDLGILNPPAVGVKEDTTEIWVQGISVGGTISLP